MKQEIDFDDYLIALLHERNESQITVDCNDTQNVKEVIELLYNQLETTKQTLDELVNKIYFKQ